MISVENFYWVLYENLLKPVGLDCWYYHPFGTTDNLSISEFRNHNNSFEHVLFHFDQEPLWEDFLGQCYDRDRYHVSYSNTIFKILANSEKSQLKTQICKDRHLSDWYFFYHGFAALDWFNDNKYINSDGEIIYVFNSMNHVCTDERSYRMALTAKLFDLGIAEYGDISFHATVDQCCREINRIGGRLSDLNKKLIKNHLIDFPDQLPLILDRTDVNGNFSARFGYHEHRMWQRSFLHVVNETVFYQPKLHLTEKIFKPIVAMRPFVLASSAGNLSYLRTYGFRTFDNWIDESYDGIQDPNLRLDLISREIEKFCKLSRRELLEIYKDMRPILEYNKNHFFGEFRTIIVNELVDNFDQCIRIWNNGRIDGRELPLHPELNRVKRILLS